MRCGVTIIGLGLALGCAAVVAVGRGADQAAPPRVGPPAAAAEAPQAAYHIGDMRVRTMGAVTYAYVEADTTFDKLGEAIGQAMPKIQKAVDAKKVTVAGPFVLVYPKGAHGREPGKPFAVHIGAVVADGATGDGDVKVRKTEPFKCAAVVYNGPTTEQGRSWQKLLPAATAAGLTPTGEEREYTLYWEGLESPNNVVYVLAGVK